MTPAAPLLRATIFDYGAGNLHSLAKAIAGANVEVTIEPDPFRALDADLVVLPGVGAFGHAAARLLPAREAWRARLGAGLPCLGVCLGLQLLLDSSEEGEGAGLGLLPGRVTRLGARRVPHIGWNTIAPAASGAIDSTFYFAHGYACRLEDESAVTAWCRHEGDRFPAVVERGAVAGVQFHPEKSSRAGAAFLARYLDRIARGFGLANAGANPCAKVTPIPARGPHTMDPAAAPGESVTGIRLEASMPARDAHAMDAAAAGARPDDTMRAGRAART